MIHRREEQKLWSFFVLCNLFINLTEKTSFISYQETKKKPNTYLVKHTKNQALNTNERNSKNTNTKNSNTKTKEMAYLEKLWGQRRRNAEEWNNPTQPIFKCRWRNHPKVIELIWSQNNWDRESNQKLKHTNKEKKWHTSGNWGNEEEGMQTTEPPHYFI